jgi:response regulator RpfG family c-di-GMP phosphodiesterase
MQSVGDPTRLAIPGPARTPRILVLEDESAIRKLVSAMLKIRGLDADTAGTVEEARRLIVRQAYDIMVVDVSLPDGSGLSPVEESPGEPLVIVITGSTDIQVAVRAIRGGAMDFITKPFTVDGFLGRLDKALQEWKARERLKGYARKLETLVEAKAEELSQTTRQVDEVRDITVTALGAALNLKDHETAGHCIRVSSNSVTLGRRLGLSEVALRSLKWGAYLHDVGKIGIPEQILLKQGTLAPEERRVMERHPLMGHGLIRNIDFLQSAGEVVLSHHERFDGSGYPSGLRGDGIPRAARIFALVDAMDAMTSDRPYRAALPFAAACAEVRDRSRTQFDPEIVEAFRELTESDWQIQDNL